jgi:hypothetical protein
MEIRTIQPFLQYSGSVRERTMRGAAPSDGRYESASD